MDYKIREFKTEDSEGLLKLFEEFFIIYFQGQILPEKLLRLEKYEDPKTEFRKDLEKYFLTGKFITYVAEIDNKLVGYIAGDIKEDDGKKVSKEGYIEDWFVTEEFRGNGIGMALYNTLIEDFKKAGCNKLGIDTYIDNTKIVDKYKSMGFIPRVIVLVKEI